MNFPKDFIFGTATASYQIEGAAFEDGKGLSIWDVSSHHKGNVFQGHNGDVACDHYHRLAEDIGLMKELGAEAYRFSLSWPRVLPNGTGAANEKGLDFYDRLIDGLLEAGIEPYITLYHWDMPYELYKRGGFLNRDIAEWFGEYTSLVVSRYSDRVKNWITINEPQCVVELGLHTGNHAPYIKLPMRDVLSAAHNLMRAHGKAVQAIRAAAKQPACIGFVSADLPKVPKTDSKADIEAARAEMFRTDFDSLFNTAWWNDAVFLGKYPEDGVKHHGANMPEIQQGDMELISQPIDFCGTNIYTGGIVEAGSDGKPSAVDYACGYPCTDMGWPVTPETLYWGPKFLNERYKKPVYITENGLAGMDWVSEDGKVHDVMRIDFLSRYLKQLSRACADGVDVRGYFQWSLMDNFEWSYGYSKRFGLVHVDLETLERTPKDSFDWYRNLIRTCKGK